MIEQTELTIGDRTLQLCLDMRALYEAEKACPGLSLIQTTGWERVASDAKALLALVYGCTWRSRPERKITDQVDDAFLGWLAENITTDQIPKLQTTLTLLYLRSMVGDEKPGDSGGSPPETPFAKRRNRRRGSSSGHSPDTISA